MEMAAAALSTSVDESDADTTNEGKITGGDDNAGDDDIAGVGQSSAVQVCVSEPVHGIFIALRAPVVPHAIAEHAAPANEHAGHALAVHGCICGPTHGAFDGLRIPDVPHTVAEHAAPTNEQMANVGGFGIGAVAGDGEADCDADDPNAGDAVGDSVGGDADNATLTQHSSGAHNG